MNKDERGNWKNAGSHWELNPGPLTSAISTLTTELRQQDKHQHLKLLQSRFLICLTWQSDRQVSRWIDIPMLCRETNTTSMGPLPLWFSKVMFYLVFDGMGRRINRNTFRCMPPRKMFIVDYLRLILRLLWVYS